VSELKKLKLMGKDRMESLISPRARRRARLTGAPGTVSMPPSREAPGFTASPT
jgi:hypothetical protein